MSEWVVIHRPTGRIVSIVVCEKEPTFFREPNVVVPIADVPMAVLAKAKYWSEPK